MKSCNQKNIKAKDPLYECNTNTGRWIKKKKTKSLEKTKVQDKPKPQPLGKRKDHKEDTTKMDLIARLKAGKITLSEIRGLPEVKGIWGRSTMNKKELIINLLLVLSGGKSPDQPAGRNCTNEYDIMGEETKAIPAEKFFRTSRGYCHNIDDLATYLIMNKLKNIDPNDTTNSQVIWESPAGKKLIFDHPGIDPELRLQLVSLENYKEKLPEQMISILDAIAETGWFLWNDKPSSHAKEGFDVSERILAMLYEKIEEHPLRDTIMNLTNGSSSTLRDEIFVAGNAGCIHGKGVFLILVYLFHHYQSFPETPLHPLFRPLPAKDRNRVVSFLIKKNDLTDVLDVENFLSPREFYFDRNQNKFVMSWIRDGYAVAPSLKKKADNILRNNRKTLEPYIKDMILRYLTA